MSSPFLHFCRISENLFHFYAESHRQFVDFGFALCYPFFWGPPTQKSSPPAAKYMEKEGANYDWHQ